MKQTPHNPNFSAVSKLESIENYLDWLIKNSWDNAQTRYLGDATRYFERKANNRISIQKNGKKHLAIAKKRLSEIEFVFITERFDEAVQTLAAKLKWRKKLRYEVLNKSEKKEILSEKSVKKVKEALKFDYELYEIAKQRHKKIVRETLNSQ